MLLPKMRRNDAVSRRILVIVGHPDPSLDRLCRGLAMAYAEGARGAGHEVRTIDLAPLVFPMLRTSQEFVLVFPLWLGTMPAKLKAFLEQVMRPGTAFAFPAEGEGFAKSLLRGRSARLVVTMGMPAAVYRIWYLNHGIAGMRRGILNFVGIRPVRETLFGMVANADDAKRAKWIGQMHALGRRGL